MPEPARAAIDLDDAQARARVDPGGMMGLVVDFPQQCRQGWLIGQQLSASLRRPRQVVITGMGGSAVGGALLASLLEHRSPACFIVNRDYALPEIVGKDSLVIAVSYSGNTEETLTAFETAAEREAQIVCVTSGGRLAELAAQRQVPVISVPGGQPPRASLGYLFFPLLAIVERAGLAPDQHADFASAVRTLDGMREHLGPDAPGAENPAKQLAGRLVGRMPFVLGSTPWLGVAAYRWRTQCNENAKMLASSNLLPELDHNEICGWADQEGTASRATPVFLRSSFESDRMRARLDATIEIIGAHAQVEQVWGEGDSPLAHALSVIYFGDFVTVYLALLRGRNPMEIAAIDRLKSVLGGNA
jgi:glucose/mannose-6-phosphate isomerase